MKCVSCDVELVPVIDGPSDNGYQYDNALWLTFHGGYAMFVESAWISSEHTCENFPQDHYVCAVLCHNCAHVMCMSYPWMSKLLEPKTSHTHTDDFLKKYPLHEKVVHGNLADG